MGRAPLLLPLLLWLHTCVPASWGLQCMHCEKSGRCEVEECAGAQDLCRTTVLQIWKGGKNLDVVERGCTHPEKTNRTMSYRTGLQIIALSETVCGSNLCNQPILDRAGKEFPRSRYLECSSCASSDLSCERGRAQDLQCRSPTEQCVEVVTHRNLEGGSRDENHVRGCGNLPGCPGPTGFHNNHTFHFLRCCNTAKCNGGPVVELQDLPVNEFQCYSCEGNSTDGCSVEETALITCRGPMNQCLEASSSHELGTPNYMLRGCATPSWCQGPHVAEIFELNNLNISCCTGSGCNGPTRDVQPRSRADPLPTSSHLNSTVTLLMVAVLWGGTLFWT
ncbi:urokinase plasminogen activator surface receptor [Sorex fumeus]|uniref:urokinase plasminogen activator surface receptor n=1 Tax=Sorex fumeus TaxID=62283 RepID=UPI0024AE749B|nr:urokinase plasminogen activator surface receptor [Sorex fumeus]